VEVCFTNIGDLIPIQEFQLIIENNCFLHRMVLINAGKQATSMNNKSIRDQLKPQLQTQEQLMLLLDHELLVEVMNHIVKFKVRWDYIK